VTDRAAAGAVVLPMFPLGAVLLPGGRLPLHVFEPRYRALTRYCLTRDRRFGVVLISRGSEVGGGEVRTEDGTVATIDRAVALPGGRYGLVTHGTHRLRVDHWLPDDPFPLAAVRILPPDPDPDAEVLRRAEAAVRRAYALRSELGEGPAWPADVRLPTVPVAAGWLLCDMAPIGQQDRQLLLREDDPSARLRLLVTLVDAVADDAARMLASG
jgi:Lon protease-like protein